MSANSHPPCIICNSTICCCLDSLFPGVLPPPSVQAPSHSEETPSTRSEMQGANYPWVGIDEVEPQASRKGAGPKPYPDFADCTEYEGLYEKAHARELALSLAKRAAPGHPPQEGQTRKASLLEAFANVLFGFWVAVLSNMLVLPLFPDPGSFRSAFQIGIIFTLISFVRSYALRRFFNLFHRKGRVNLRAPWKH